MTVFFWKGVKNRESLLRGRKEDGGNQQEIALQEKKKKKKTTTDKKGDHAYWGSGRLWDEGPTQRPQGKREKGRFKKRFPSATGKAVKGGECS